VIRAQPSARARVAHSDFFSAPMRAETVQREIGVAADPLRRRRFSRPSLVVDMDPEKRPG